MTRKALKIHLAANYADTMPDYVDGNYVRGLEEGYKKGWDDADEHPKNPWRDAQTDPPKLTDTYYVRTKEGCADMAFYDKGKDCWYKGKTTDGTPKLWMPIPSVEGGEK